MIVTLSTTSLKTRAAHMPAKLPPITRALVAGMGHSLRRARYMRGEFWERQEITVGRFAPRLSTNLACYNLRGCDMMSARGPFADTRYPSAGWGCPESRSPLSCFCWIDVCGRNHSVAEWQFVGRGWELASL